MNGHAGAFAAVFAALYCAHQVGDHWIQSGWQAGNKHRRDRTGRLACAAHVTTLTITKLVFVAAVTAALLQPFQPGWLIAALAVDAVSHYWADRRFTLAWLCARLGKGDFYRLGAPRPDRDDNPSLGTGAYALDQSWHIAWLFVTALIATVGAG